MRAAQGVAPEHPRDDQVARVCECSRDLRRGVDPADELADLPDLQRSGACHPDSQPHGVEDLRVAGAATEVARQRLADLVVARVGAARKQVDRRDDEPRRAEAALDGACVDERLLDRMQAPPSRQPFDRRHLVPVGLHGEHEAGAHERAVEQHRARAALTLLAGVLGAGKPELLAQREEERLALPAVGLCSSPLIRTVILTPAPARSARSARTRSACRR